VEVIALLRCTQLVQILGLHLPEFQQSISFLLQVVALVGLALGAVEVVLENSCLAPVMR
jgi:hypothetical protein